MQETDNNSEETNNYEITGTLDSVEKKLFVAAKGHKEGFEKQQFVIKTPGNYPQFILFEITGKGIRHLTEIPVGSQIIVNFNLRGNKGSQTGKCFTWNRAWKIAQI